MSDNLFNGRRFRALTVVDNFSRECTDNPFIESFNGSLRDECLNIHRFLSLEDAQDKLDNWRREYNHENAFIIK